MKKMVVGALLVLLVLMGVLVYTFTREVTEQEGIEERGFPTIADYAENTEFFEKIKATRVESEGIIGELYLNGYRTYRDMDTGRHFYSMTQEESAYTPTVRYETTQKKVQVAFDRSQITGEQIKNNQSLMLIAYTERNYEEIEIVCTTLPLMSLELEGPLSKEEEVVCHMQLLDNRKDAEYRELFSDGTCHVRGMSSAAWPKQGIRLDLTKEVEGKEKKNKLNLLNLREDDNWILYAAYNDQEKIRNVFSSQIWKDSCASNNAFGVDNGMEYRYMELFINGGYYGLYALGYPIDKKQLDLKAEGEESTWEYSYKKKNWLEETVEYTWTDGPLAGYEIQCRAKPTMEDAWKPLKKYYQNLLGAQEVETQRIIDSVDMKSAVDLYLFVNLIQGGDNLGKNTYFTAKTTNDGYRILFTPWDMDYTWGNACGFGKNGTDCYEISPSRNYITEYTGISKLLSFEDEGTRNMVKDRYAQLRSDLWSEDNLMQMLDEFETDIYDSGAFIRDSKRWPDGFYNTPEEGLDRFREYVKERLRYMDQYIEDEI